MNLLKDNLLKIYFKFLIPSLGGAALASALGMVVQVTVGITHFFARGIISNSLNRSTL